MGIGSTHASRHLRLVTPPSSLSDGELVAATRGGDSSAYAELWQRHSHAAITVARSYTSFDADDVVAEAFANVYAAISRGGGPMSGFRPYLFTTVRNVASQWGRAANTRNVEDIESIGHIFTESDTLDRLEKTLTVTAFRSLPEKWQEVLWYSEVESMTPRQSAPLIGLSPNAVSALTLRAREGLRVAWIKAHLSSTSAEPECLWTLGKLTAWSRGTMSQRLKTRIEAHLEGCAQCRSVAEEASNVNSSLALILLPLVAGVVGASGYVTSLESGTSRMPVAMTAGTGMGTVSVAGAGVAVVGGLVAAALVAAVCLVPSYSGTAAAGTPPLRSPRPPATEVASEVPSPASTPSAPFASAPLATVDPTKADGETVPAPESASPAAGLPLETTAPASPALDDVSPAELDAPNISSSQRPVIVYPAVRGTAAPHAVVTLTVQGIADDWTVVADPAGSWEAELTGLTPGLWAVTGVQSVTDASGARVSEVSNVVTVELVDPPRAINSDVSASPLDGSLTGLPDASYGVTLVNTTGGVWEGTLTLDAGGHGWVPLPREGGVRSIIVFYVFGDWVGPTRVIVPPFR
jgi:RNA polymerase sigma factor (sigma-70 family)